MYSIIVKGHSHLVISCINGQQQIARETQQNVETLMLAGK